jgi:hypothetical protein
MLFYLNKIIETTEVLPDDIFVPTLTSSKPADWWTISDDRILLYGIYQFGFLNYQLIKLSVDLPVQSKALTLRSKNLIEDIKLTFNQTPGKLELQNSTLKHLYNKISLPDHRAIMFILFNFGFTDFKTIQELAELTSKSIEIVEDYVKKIIDIIEENALKNPIDDSQLVERIIPTQCGRLNSRISLFQKVRDSIGKPGISEQDNKILIYVAEHGFLDLSESTFIKNIFGAEGIEGKLVRHLKDILKQTDKKKTIIFESTTIQPFQCDEQANAILLLKISSILTILSLGQIVYQKSEFHTERYIYPAGYTVERLFTSCENPNDKELYICEIVDDGHPYPLFKVSLKNNSDVRFEANLPSNV